MIRTVRTTTVRYNYHMYVCNYYKYALQQLDTTTTCMSATTTSTCMHYNSRHNYHMYVCNYYKYTLQQSDTTTTCMSATTTSTHYNSQIQLPHVCLQLLQVPVCTTTVRYNYHMYVCNYYKYALQQSDTTTTCMSATTTSTHYNSQIQLPHVSLQLIQLCTPTVDTTTTMTYGIR